MVRLQALLILTGVLLCVAPTRGDEIPVTAGDRLAVNVAGEADLTGLYTVDDDGTVFLPMVGKVPVRGQSPAQVREELAKRLTRYLRNPQVSVEFRERAQLTVGFTGMVRKPGSVRLPKGSRLLDGLAMAEGLQIPDADEQNVRLQRRGEPAARILDLRHVDRQAPLNLELQEGDAIYVPRVPMNVVRVLGAVNKPGEVQKKETVTVLEAVLAAGGLTPDAERRQVQILRKDAKQPELLNLDDVLSGAVPNPVLRDGDTLTLPAQAKVLVKVFGLVTKPGEGEMRSGITVLEAIVASGGFAMEADKAAVFVTSADGDVQRLNLDKLESRDGARVLKSGDRLFVPQAAPRRYAVAGGVHEPGLFPMPADASQKIYLTDALAQAKGPIDRAKKKSIVVIRRSPTGGQPIPIHVDFEALLKQKDPTTNIEILVNDVVYVDAAPEGRERRRPLETILGIAGALIGF